MWEHAQNASELHLMVPVIHKKKKKKNVQDKKHFYDCTTALIAIGNYIQSHFLCEFTYQYIDRP